MIPNWRYWSFMVVMCAALVAFHALAETPWRYAVLFVLGAIYTAFFDKFRKRMVEVPK